MKKLELKSLNDFDFKGKNVFMRADFNVPLQDGKVIDSYRIEKALPSCRFILERGGRLILSSHLGRPGGKKDPHLSLKPVAERLSEIAGLEILFVEELDSEAPRRLVPGLKSQQAIFLENLRFHPGEEARDHRFAKLLASCADIYINEAFGISHRTHASLTLLPQYVSQKALGFQFEKEIEKLDIIRTGKAKTPFFVILGGSKLKDKIPLMEALIDRADGFFVGGLMALAFLKAMGKSVGGAPIEEDCAPHISSFMERLSARGKQLFLPVDHIVERGGRAEVLNGGAVPKGAVPRDIGPATLKLFQERIQTARSIFWNGPLGFFEKEEFRAGTRGLAQALAQHKGAFRVIGGGHSALAVRDFEKDLDHVSTGGGASLFYLRGGSLPGLKSLVTEVPPSAGQAGFLGGLK